MSEHQSPFRPAARFAGSDSSPLKEIFALAARPGLVSFAGGIPDPALFDLAGIHRAYDWTLTHQGRRALQYGITEGEDELREQAARRLNRHLPTSASQIQVTSGSQEGIFLVAQALLEPGDVVLVESPTYLAAVQAFGASGAHMVGVPTDEHGVVPDGLEAAIRAHHPKFVYLIPTFQNPTGRTMPALRRAEVADVLLRHGVPLVEDDPYGELRYAGEPVAPIAALPGMGERTLLLNSISKLMAPGLRLGWMRGDGPIMRTLAVAKAAVSMQSSVVDQLTVARYLEAGDLDAHVAAVRTVYWERREALARALAAALPEGARLTDPEGGMFLWATLGAGWDTQELLASAVEAGVAYLPGWSFYATDPDFSTMRLSFVTHTPEVITASIARLGEVLHAAH